jgi:phosphoribosylformimino-5-aminoimidazole carboxamide ribotide isomerase
LARVFERDGVEAIVYTDIGRDGMMQGLNLEATVKLARSTAIPVIASGGVSTLEDIIALCNTKEEGIMGAIIGRALYEGSIDLATAQKIADAATE